MLVMLVAAAKMHFEKQALVAGTKQSSQDDKAGKVTRQAGMAVGHACFVLCQLQHPHFVQVGVLKINMS
jgi:hypothetical protein